MAAVVAVVVAVAAVDAVALTDALENPESSCRPLRKSPSHPSGGYWVI